MDIFKHEIRHNAFRQANDETGTLRAGGGEVRNTDIAIHRSFGTDWLSSIFFWDFGIVAGDVDGNFDIGHFDVAVANIFDEAAAATIGFYAQATDGVFEGAIANGEVAHAAYRFAADGHAVAMQECAINDRDVFASGGPARNRVAGFQRDIVIADIEYAFCDENIFARTGIDGVGVGRISRSPNRDMVDYDVFTVGRDQMEAGRVLQRDSLN